MKRAGRCLPLVVLVALAAAAPGGAAESALGRRLTPAVDGIVRLAPSSGVHVVDLESGETVLSHQPDLPRIIASNAKLVTTAAALDALGPGYFFETRFLARGPTAAERLGGDLAVVGGGDPNISGRYHEGDSLAVFRQWAAALRRAGVTRVEGDLFLVHGLFEPPVIHPDWPRDQLSRWYEAPVEALSFNDNCVLVRVWPGGATGRPARVETIPDLPIFELDNRAATTGSARRHRVAIDRVNGSTRLWVTGSVLRGAAPVDAWVTVPDPLQYFGSALLAAFEQEGVEVTGEIRPAVELPAGDWRQVAAHRSDLLTTLEVINKRSQNFYAESLLKLLGAERCGGGSWEAGLEVVAEFLAGFGIEPESYRLADGSGMSRNDRMTPRQLTTLLARMRTHPYGREYFLSLPHSGEAELSWERRLAEPPYRGNIFAKTGSLRGVSTLSGYAKARSGRLYAFSILMNDSGERWRARNAQDRLVRDLVDSG